eukprot:14492234-Alexandrium_andersonii.AAC.1
MALDLALGICLLHFMFALAIGTLLTGLGLPSARVRPPFRGCAVFLSAALGLSTGLWPDLPIGVLLVRWSRRRFTVHPLSCGLLAVPQ